jgi:hypothetical protein
MFSYRNWCQSVPLSLPTPTNGAGKRSVRSSVKSLSALWPSRQERHRRHTRNHRTIPTLAVARRTSGARHGSNQIALARTAAEPPTTSRSVDGPAVLPPVCEYRSISDRELQRDVLSDYITDFRGHIGNGRNAGSRCNIEPLGENSHLVIGIRVRHRANGGKISGHPLFPFVRMKDKRHRFRVDQSHQPVRHGCQKCEPVVLGGRTPDTGKSEHRLRGNVEPDFALAPCCRVWRGCPFRKRRNGTRQRLSGFVNAVRQNGEVRLRTLVTGRDAATGCGKPHRITATSRTPSQSRITGASRSG